MSDTIQKLIDAYHPTASTIDKYQSLMLINTNIVQDNILLRQQIKSYQYYIGVTCVMFCYAGIIYYIEK